MTREIKFRAWDKGQKDMKFGELKKGTIFWNGALLNGAEDTLMQFIGLKDKNGKEIYEGDIVNTEEGIGYISYYIPDCKFIVVIDGYWDDLDRTLNCYPQIEIIGNIYENPELLNLKTQKTAPNNNLNKNGGENEVR